ncbi:MAG: hypothetical protein P8104_10080 [Gammaproteobacteria bacterium]
MNNDGGKNIQFLGDKASPLFEWLKNTEQLVLQTWISPYPQKRRFGLTAKQGNKPSHFIAPVEQKGRP